MTHEILRKDAEEAIIEGRRIAPQVVIGLLDEIAGLIALKLEMRAALRNMADAYVRKMKSGLTPEEIAKEPWRCAEYIEAERLCKVPMKLHFTAEWLRRKIESNPDIGEP